MLQWLKHAFAVETSPAVPTEAQQEQIDRVCREIVQRRMTLPAQMMLESSRSMNYVAGQSLRLVEPFLGTVFDAHAIREFAAFVERPGAVEYICTRLEYFESQYGKRPETQ